MNLDREMYLVSGGDMCALRILLLAGGDVGVVWVYSRMKVMVIRQQKLL